MIASSSICFLYTTRQVFSAVELTAGVGAYRLSVNFSSSVLSTRCLYWDSSAEEVETALELLSNVDSVEVERAGSGTAEDTCVVSVAYSRDRSTTDVHRKSISMNVLD